MSMNDKTYNVVVEFTVLVLQTRNLLKRFGLAVSIKVEGADGGLILL
jgi:hypothetical protein